jgi:cytochrome c oxidase subunit 2
VGKKPSALTGLPRGGTSRAARRRRAGAVLVAVLALLASSCTAGSHSILSPEGSSAKRVTGLWWLMFWISAVVFAVVVALIAIAILRRRRRGVEIDVAQPRWGEPFVVVAGVFVPIVILTSVFAISLHDLNAIASGDPRLTIHVIGHMWWWEVRYPNGAVGANEIHIPTGEPVRVDLTTADVIHSFWVPQLAPKLDMIPGRVNSLLITAERSGRYRGQCAEFCGLQHAHMAFYVVAQPPGEFASWMAHEVEPAPTPTGEAAAGLNLFLGSNCSGCHTISGTSADATLGPDLTHVASRETIAAGTLTNTFSNMAAWIRDPQAFKPGAVMPPSPLTASEVRQVVAYLESLS